MSHVSGDAGDSSSTIHAWNRTPGKPNLSAISGNVGVPWGSSSNFLDVDKFSGDSNPLEDVWSKQSESSSRKIENPSSQWPTPAELAGGSIATSLTDFGTHNKWNAPSGGAAMSLRSGLGSSDDHTDSVAPGPRAITGQQAGGGNLSAASADEKICFPSSSSSHQRPHLSSIGNKTCGADSFSSWGSQADGDFGGFASQPSVEGGTSTGKHEKRTLSGEGSGLNATACSSISDSGNHTDGHCENDAIVSALVNTKECWGQRPVDQSTPWDVSQLPVEESATGTATPFNQPSQSTSNLLGDALTIALQQQQQQQRRIKGGLASKQAVSSNSFESNVWPSEPPTGTGIWEMHYENLGELTARWKQPPPISTTASSPCLSRLAQPGGITSAMGILSIVGGAPSGSESIPPVFGNVPPSGVNPSQGSAGDMQRRGGGGGNGGLGGGVFFPQQAQRFGSQGPLSQTFPILGGNSGNGRNGPNGMLGMPGSFRQLQPSGGPSGWPFGAESPGQLDDGPKGFANNVGSWPENISQGRAIGKQQQKIIPNQSCGDGNGGNNRWPSPVGDSPSGWTPSSSDPRKLTGGWNPMGPSPGSQNQPFMMPPYRVDSNLPIPRFHPPPSARQLPQRNFNALALIRTNVARSLLNLGYSEEAQTLLTDPNIDMERLLCDLRDRTGNMGLTQLIASVSSALASSMSPSDPPLSAAFDSAGSSGAGVNMFDPSTRDQNQQRLLRPNNFGPPGTAFGGGASNTGSKFSRPNLDLNHPDFISQLQQRENQLVLAILSLEGKHRELGAKQGQLRKMNVSPAPNSVLQELQLQRAQVVQQVDVHQAQLSQVRRQILILNQLAASGNAGGGVGPPPNHSPLGLGMPNTTSPFDLDVGVSMMNQRGNGPPPPHMNRGISPLHFGQQQNNNNSGRVGGGSLMMNSDLSMRMSEMKLGQQQNMDMRRQMAWEGGGGSAGMMWGSNPNSAPGAGRLTNNNHNLDLHIPEHSSTNNFDDSHVPPANPLGGDRRWAPTETCNSTSGNENSAAFAWSSSLPSATRNSFLSDSCCWLLVSDIAPHLSLDTLKLVVSSALEQSGAGNNADFEIHPNMAARYVLLGFANPIDANSVATLIANNAISSGIRLGSTEIISSSEAMAKLQEIKY